MAGEELYESEDYFGGTLNYIITTSVSGQNPTRQQQLNTDTFYIPAPMVLADLDRNGRRELIINRNKSATLGLTERFKAFLDGTIVSLSWDGLSLDPNWESRKLPGVLSGYQIADVDHDGKPDLAVSVLEKRGASFFSKARSVVVSYRLTPKAEKK
jgi:hypothetical protein